MKYKNAEPKVFVIPRSKDLQDPVFHNKAVLHKQLFCTLAFAVGFLFSASVAANSMEVEAAIDLMKQSHMEQCQKIKIKRELLIAHQNHDQARLKALSPELDAINQRLKPTEDKLKILKAAMMKNPDDESDFATAMLHLDACK
ncbi:hypothetical protein [Candidatus Methylobacter oryzae]|uniref:Uncharacterized protein n=1 Tax=Candidatus Methylobacter oryzae TaxID=2497749 RepID=A0ABY3CGF0_9GAMM|nr:hypothetical protein [Candidatus Methylobacter oryzae]TRX02965.1 hypothetical protein EKO24_001385 [Candidatus Methylobacter oryzae]